MVNILIDGYNFIGNDLIQKLNTYARGRELNITVVFDGWKDGRAAETKIRIGKVTIIYSCLGEKADDVRKRMLSSSTKPWIAVSSDREVYTFAEKNHCAALSRDEFEVKLGAALAGRNQHNGAEEFFENDEDYDLTPAGKKGNPRKLSKKDKRKSEALKKL